MTHAYLEDVSVNLMERTVEQLVGHVVPGTEDTG